MEGQVLIKDAIDSNAHPIEVVISSKEENPEELLKTSGIKGKVGEKTKIYILAAELFQKISQTENGRNIFGIFEKRNWDEESFEKKVGTSNILILEGLQDPGNIGTIIRTAEAAGFGGILAVKGTADIYSPKIVRSAAGGILRVPIMYMPSVEETIAFARKLNKKLCVTAVDGRKSFWEADLSGNIALVIGNEGNGVSEEMLRAADEVLTIPMEGKIESLNAGISAGVIMYEAFRQRQNQFRKM